MSAPFFTQFHDKKEEVQIRCNLIPIMLNPYNSGILGIVCPVVSSLIKSRDTVDEWVRKELNSRNSWDTNLNLKKEDDILDSALGSQIVCPTVQTMCWSIPYGNDTQIWDPTERRNILWICSSWTQRIT